MGVWHNIWTVVRRELRIWLRRPVYLLGSVGVMAFCAVFFLTFFRDGLPHDLPIGIVDNDNSSMSRNFIQQMDATQLGQVVQFSNFEEAREAMMSGKITSICVIPEGMYADVSANRRPTFTYEREIMGRIQPVAIDTHQIGNVTTNYGYYLTNILLPGMLELIVIIVLIYSLGAELKYGTSKHLVQSAGGSMLDALLGKLLIYTVLFSALGLILIVLLYHWMHFPIAGSIWNMFLAIVLMVLAAEGIAIFIIGCLPVPRLALSIGALYSVLGFTLAGFTLPVEALPPFVQGLSAAFPLRHYYLFYCQEVIFGAGFAGWWQEVVHLLLFLFLPLAVLPRLRGAFINQNFPTN